MKTFVLAIELVMVILLGLIHISYAMRDEFTAAAVVLAAMVWLAWK